MTATTTPHSDRTRLIRAAVERMTARRPHLAALAERAAAVVTDGCITYLGDTHIYIRSAGGHEYRIGYHADTDDWTCTCPAYLYKPTIVNGRHLCKHIVAYSMSRLIEREPAAPEQNHD